MPSAFGVICPVAAVVAVDEATANLRGRGYLAVVCVAPVRVCPSSHCLVRVHSGGGASSSSGAVSGRNPAVGSVDGVNRVQKVSDRGCCCGCVGVRRQACMVTMQCLWARASGAAISASDPQHSLHCICCVAQRMLTVGSTTPLLVTEAVE